MSLLRKNAKIFSCFRWLTCGRHKLGMMSTCTKQDKVRGRVALITASTDGIGFAIAKRLAEEGAKVMISSRNRENVDRALDSLKMYDVAGTICHAGVKEDRTRLLNETNEIFGGIDILVTNAAVNPGQGKMLETSEEVWDKIFDVNVKSTFLFIKAAVPYMQKRGALVIKMTLVSNEGCISQPKGYAIRGGSIVIIGSTAAYFPLDLDIIGAYSVSKTALLGLTAALAPQLASMNIRVNGLAPGAVNTKFSERMRRDEKFARQLMATIQMKRYAEADEMCGAVSFLASDDSRYITGETIRVPGGMPGKL